jgi:hypothetical protein
MSLLENKNFREFIELLNSTKVRFLIVGGHAVGLHGYPRFTADLDVWIATDPGNAEKVLQVLKDFGFGNMFSVQDFQKRGYAIQLGRQPSRIDILTSIDAVEFDDAYKNRQRIKADGLALPVIALPDLLTNKRATARPQDLADVAKLETQRKRRSR